MSPHCRMFDTCGEVHLRANKSPPSAVQRGMGILEKSQHALWRGLASLAVGVGVSLSAQAEAEALTNIDDEELAGLLESEESSSDELAHHLGDVIESASVLTRTRLLTSWVTSPNARVRLLAAQSLQRPFVVLGAGSALELLRNDTDEAVQTAAKIASVVRRVSLG